MSEILVAHAGKFVTGYDVAFRNSCLRRYGAGGRRIVSRDHHNANARRLALCDGSRNVLPQSISKARQAGKTEAEARLCVRECAMGNLSLGDPQNSQSLRGHGVGGKMILSGDVVEAPAHLIVGDVDVEFRRFFDLQTLVDEVVQRLRAGARRTSR